MYAYMTPNMTPNMTPDMTPTSAVSTDAVYLTAKRATKQTIPPGLTWCNQIIIMDVKKGNGIDYDTNSGIFSLDKGKTYRITAQLGWEATTQEYYQFGLFYHTRGEHGFQVGPLAEALPPNRKTFNASGDLLDVIFTPPSTGGKYCLKMSSDVTAPCTSAIRADVSTFLNIVALDDETFTPDYVSAKRSTRKAIGSGVWGGRVIEFDDVMERRELEYDREFGIFKLLAGKTYRITAQLGWEATTPEFYAFGLFDSTGKQFGPLAEALPPNRDTCNASIGVLDVIHTPLEAGEYCLKMAWNVTAPTSSFIRADASTFLNIVELSPNKYALSGRRFTNQTIPSGTWDYKIVDINEQETPEKGAHSPLDMLKDGKTYRVTATLGWKATTSQFYQFGVFDEHTDKPFAPLAEALSPNRDTCNASGGVLDVIFTVDKTNEASLGLRTARTMTAPATSVIRADVSTQMVLVEL